MEYTIGIILSSPQAGKSLWDQKPAIWDPAGTQNSAEVRHINSMANGAAILDNETFGRLGSHHQKVLVVKGSQGSTAAKARFWVTRRQ